MVNLPSGTWENMNKIIYDIYSVDDSHKVRKSFLEEIRFLVPFEMAEFSLASDDGDYYDSVEINTISNNELNIMDIYRSYRAEHNMGDLYWIFKPEDSFIIRTSDLLSKEGYKDSLFYKFFLSKLKMDYCCTMSFKDGPHFLGEVSFYNSENSGDFSDREIYILSQFINHWSLRLRILHKRGNETYISENKYLELYQSGLSNRETEIVKHILRGSTNEMISEQLFISVHTVKKHISNIYKKLGLQNREQLKDFF